jgi:hypothetical protein
MTHLSFYPRYGLGFLFALGLGLACGDGGVSDGTDGTCEPGQTVDCACENGDMGQQVCAEDGQSFGACDCSGAETGENGTEASTTIGDGDGDTGDGDGDGDTGDGDGDTGDGDGDGDAGDGDGEPVGEVPVVEIWHPGDGETRPVDVPIPWTGNATDAEDGDISTQIVWTSSLDGQFGMGDNFQAPLSTPGEHTITATVMDNDANVGMASITLMLE